MISSTLSALTVTSARDGSTSCADVIEEWIDSTAASASVTHIFWCILMIRISLSSVVKVCAAALCLIVPQAQAHEFWIEAEDWIVAPGDTAVAHFRLGQEFKGSSMSYLPQRTARYDVAQGDTVAQADVVIGDRPAFSMTDADEGLLIVIHETTSSSLTYNERDGRSGWERFNGFIEHKAMTGVPEAHLARGLPKEGIKEDFARFAKALIAVGDGAGEDRAFGLRTEIVALENPYTDDMTDGIDVQVLLDGEPRAGSQVELFEKTADGEVTITLHTADENGMATLPVSPGLTYFADSVAMLPLEGDAMWESLWAALTFAVPEE